jgi:hypothetical protein
MRLPFLPVAALGALAVALAAATSALGGPSANVLDRTFRCTVGAADGFRTLAVSAHAGQRQLGRPNRWASVARANFRNAATDDGGLAGVGAGSPAAEDGSALLWISSKRCRVATARVGLTRRGLPVGGAPGRFGDVYECPVGRTVFVRVRAELARPSRLKRDSLGVLATSTPVVSATLAARTQAGKLVAVATVAESGSARLFVNEGCLPE